MYHIKQDQRSLLSAKMLQDGLSGCLSVRKYTDISISELCDTAHVSRTTFYRLFDSIDDLLQYTLDTLAQKAISQLNTGEAIPATNFLPRLFDFIKENMKLYETVIMSKRTDIMTSALHKIATKVVYPEIQGDFSESEKDYLAALLISAAITMNQVNLSHGRKDTPEDLLKIFYKIMRIFT
jgi:AcrR family transcriptional regulator